MKAARTSGARVPTGDLDRIVTVAVDWTARVPLLLITTLRRSPSEVSDDAFRPVHTITMQAQYGEVLLERIREAIAPPSRTPTEGTAR
jgi:hypothetical protein